MSGSARHPLLAPPLGAVLAVAGLGVAQSHPLKVAQSDDGRFAAPGGGREDLRFTAVSVLALLADGSTVRAGPYRPQTKNAVRWLRDRIDERGRIGHDARPDWLLDHMIAATALTEAYRLSDYHTMQRDVAAVVAAAAEGLAQPGLVDVETLWWGAWLADAARGFEDEFGPQTTLDGAGRLPPCRWRDGAIQVDRLEFAVLCAKARASAREGSFDAQLLEHLRGVPLARLGRLDERSPRERFMLACRAYAPDSPLALEFSEALAADDRLRRRMEPFPAARLPRVWSADSAYDWLTLTIYHRYMRFDAIAGQPVDRDRARDLREQRARRDR